MNPSWPYVTLSDGETEGNDSWRKDQTCFVSRTASLLKKIQRSRSIAVVQQVASPPTWPRASFPHPIVVASRVRHLRGVRSDIVLHDVLDRSQGGLELRNRNTRNGH
eukprot:766334-Hanusia_phi.AAC.1